VVFYLVNKEDEAAMSLIQKMADQARNGAIIKVTPRELDAYDNMIRVEVPDNPKVEV